MARRTKAKAGESTRDRIIATASAHLATGGPRGVELRAVCEELDISPSLVNYYFASPGEVIWEAAVLGYSRYVEEQEAAMRSCADGEAALRGWVEHALAWTRANPGIAAVVDFPMVALNEHGADAERFASALSPHSRKNVALLGSAVFALMTGKELRILSSTRVAAMIRINAEYAYWVSTIGFSTLGAAMWVAGRKPYGLIWRAFGFDPDSQVSSSIDEAVRRITAKRIKLELPPDPDDE
ncbi:MAG: TetR/AcrR family transcriptional regulator [Gaiellales bacterium]